MLAPGGRLSAAPQKLSAKYPAGGETCPYHEPRCGPSRDLITRQKLPEPIDLVCSNKGMPVPVAQFLY